MRSAGRGSGAGWLGTPAAVQLLLTFGSSAVLWPYFHLATASIIFQLTSTAVAFGIFLVLCDEILGPPGQESQRPYALIVFLMLVASGTRANLLPMLCGGIGLVLVAHVRQGYKRLAYVGLLGAAMLAIIAGAVFFLGMGGGGSNGTSLLLIRPLNVAVSEVERGCVFSDRPNPACGRPPQGADCDGLSPGGHPRAHDLSATRRHLCPRRYRERH